jgi:hypothetical protein
MNPTKLGLHFSVFFMIFYAFYKFQPNCFTIEDATFHRGPWEFRFPYKLKDRNGEPERGE